MHRLLPVLVIFLIAAFLYTPLKREIVYKVQDQTHQKVKLTAESPSCIDSNSLTNLTGEFDQNAKLAFFNNDEVDYPKTSLASLNDQENVLAAYDANGKEKWIEVDIDHQMLRAWEGNQIVREYPISSGLWYATPRGTYEIYWKLRYIRMRGGSEDLGTYYDLPNVPDTMFFYQGYGIHGAYWHNNFGHPMSHGCVNEPLDQAHWLFEWAGPRINPDQNSVRATADNPGSKVFIH